MTNFIDSIDDTMKQNKDRAQALALDRLAELALERQSGRLGQLNYALQNFFAQRQLTTANGMFGSVGEFGRAFVMEAIRSLSALGAGRGEGLRPGQFYVQSYFSENLSREGTVTFRRPGLEVRTVTELSQAIKSGTLKLDEVPVEVYSLNGTT